MSDASGVTTYQYNSRNWLTNKHWQSGILPVSFSSSLAYTHDPHGNLTSIKSSTQNGRDITYQYDQLNRLVVADDGKVGRTTYVYDQVGNLQHYTYPNGITTSYEYDSPNRLTNMAAAN